SSAAGYAAWTAAWARTAWSTAATIQRSRGVRGVSTVFPSGPITTTSTLWPLIVSQLMALLLLAPGCPKPGSLGGLRRRKALYRFAPRIVRILGPMVHAALGRLNRGHRRTAAVRRHQGTVLAHRSRRGRG